MDTQLLIGFAFFMTMVAITGVSWSIQKSRSDAQKQSDEMSRAVRSEQMMAQNLYEEAVQEAIRRDPTLTRTDDPKSVERLSKAVVVIQDEIRLKAAVELAERNREESEHQARLKQAKQERQDQQRRQKEERQARLLAVPAWRRWISAYPGAAAGGVAVLAVLLIAGGVLGFRSWQHKEALQSVAASFEARDWGEAARWTGPADVYASLGPLCSSAERVSKASYGTFMLCGDLVIRLIEDWRAWLDAETCIYSDRAMAYRMVIGPNWVIDAAVYDNWPISPFELVGTRTGGMVMTFGELDEEVKC